MALNNSKLLPATYRREDVWVVIPTLNEVTTLPDIIAACRPFCAEVLVVDGGSTDGTIEAAKAAGTRVEILLEKGKGLALRRALEIVPVAVTVFIDADGSHEPEDIALLAQPVLDGKADMIIGCRWTGGSDELHGDMNKWLRRSGSRVLTTLVNWRFGGKLTDIQNGFRAVSTPVGRAIGLQEPDFTIEQEMAMKFLAGKFRVWNLPTHEYSRRGGEAKLNLKKVWFRFGVVVLRHLFGLDRPKINARKNRN